MAELNESLSRLSETFNQYSAAALTNLSLPEFSGKPGQDINDFLRRFKSATITLADDLKCQALNRSLIEPAYTWAKANIKSEIKSGNWKGAKQKLLKRFTLEDIDLKYHEKLSRLKYDPRESTLSSFVEVYADLFKKTHSTYTDKDIILALRFNLPAEILGHLNSISDNWTDLESLADMMKLIQRIERKILPYRKQDKSDDNNIALLAKTIKELQDTIIAQKSLEKPHAEAQTEVVALVDHQRSNRYRPQGQNRAYNGEPRHPNADRYRSNQTQGKRDNYYSRQDDPERKRRPPDESPEEMQRRYEVEFGKPPGPCWKCRGAHFNRHCPYMQLKN